MSLMWDDVDDEVIAAVKRQRRFTCTTKELPFEAAYDVNKDRVSLFLVGRSTGHKRADMNDRKKIWIHWLKTGSWDAKDYTDVGNNAEYLLAILQETGMEPPVKAEPAPTPTEEPAEAPAADVEAETTH